jgi:thiol:disulfide interchange protein
MNMLSSALSHLVTTTASRAVIPVMAFAVIGVFLGISFCLLMAAGGVWLAELYGPVIALLVLGGVAALAAAIAAVWFYDWHRRAEQRRKNAQMTTLLAVVAPRLIASSPIGSLVAVAAAAYVLSKARD